MKRTISKQKNTRDNFATTAIRSAFAPQSEQVARPMAPAIIVVTPEEKQQIADLADALIKEYGMYDTPAFLNDLCKIAFRKMPERLINILSAFAGDFSYHQYGAIIFVGLINVDQVALGPTPATYKDAKKEKTVANGFISALMHGLLKAVPIMLQQQRNGKEGGLLHDIIPNPEMKFTQTGEGTIELTVHTEDSNLYSAARFISMLFLRNFEKVPSMLYSIRSHDMEKDYIEELYKKDYRFPLDDNFSEEEKNKYKTKESILFGNKLLPYLRFDPVEQIKKSAGQSRKALAVLKQFDADAKELIYTGYIPQAGDFIMVNNLLCCHGRGGFNAGITEIDGIEYPCENRWMQRMLSGASKIEMFPHMHEQSVNLITEKHFGQ